VDPSAATEATSGSAAESARRGSRPRRAEAADRSPGGFAWYRFVQFFFATLFAVLWTWRATGRANVPRQGGVLLVANHLSFLDVFLMGMPLPRPLNYVARSTLFIPGLGFLMWSVGAFPIQREGMGASGMKETLRRLRSGGIVTLFPEGTRSADGELGPLKQGIAVLVSRAGVPVVPAGIAGTFESWPRSRLIPIPCPIRIHYGRPITPEQIAGMSSENVTALIRERIEESLAIARRGLASDLGRRGTGFPS
jgi:1-acyl-sn-glycerol-3-phosphate acyltransferase